MTRAQAIAAIRHFEAAVRDDAWRGAAHPSARQSIENAYHRALERMIAHLTKEKDA